jgi:hypothetical protein
MKSIAKWLSKNYEPYFAEVIYDLELYEAKECVSTDIFSSLIDQITPKYETEKEVSLNDRITLNKNEWKIVHSGLKNVDEIDTKLTSILKDINESTVIELKFKFDLYELEDLV